MVFNILVSETLERVVPIVADSKADAERIAELMWSNEQIVLDADDFAGVKIICLEEEK